MRGFLDRKNKLDRIAYFDAGVFSARNIGRAARWSAAVGELRQLLDEFAAWRDSLPEQFAGSPLAGKLEVMADFEGQIEELEGADLPQGFGRD
jgi:hypothetical protein